MVDSIRSEERAAGGAPEEDALVRKFAGWRDELSRIRGGSRSVGADAEDVKRETAIKGDALFGSLYGFP